MTDHVEISLEGGTVLLDRDVYEKINRSIYIGTNGYPYFSVWEVDHSQPYTVHAVAMNGPKKGMHVDHIDGNKLDCRRSNLRWVTHSQNQVNRKKLNKNNTSGCRGVTKGKRKAWKAQITVDGINAHLGEFDDIEDAIRARRNAEITFFGGECPS